MASVVKVVKDDTTQPGNDSRLSRHRALHANGKRPRFVKACERLAVLGVAPSLQLAYRMARKTKRLQTSGRETQRYGIRINNGWKAEDGALLQGVSGYDKERPLEKEGGT